MRRTLEEAFEVVNWKNIHAYMVINGWRYADINQTPTIDDLQATVMSLMQEIRRSTRDNTSTATGGFIVSKWTFDTGVHYEIVFNIASRHP